MSASLRDLRKNTDYFLAQIRKEWPKLAGPAARVRAVRLHAKLFQRQGLLALLINLDPVEFSRAFSRAGAVWLALLRAARGSNVKVAASPCEVALGLLGVGDIELARAIASASATTRTPPEYEDEFRAADLFQCFAREGLDSSSDSPVLSSACDRLEAAGGPSSALRAELGRAVLRRDAERAGDLLVALHAAYEKQLDEQSQSPNAKPDDLQLARALWIEGLAWIAISRARGLGEPPQLDCVPPWALAARAQPHGSVDLLVRAEDSLA